ncbi:MAG: hypothetical protein BWY59_01533 [Verrucomicrobia bacterium ADurb.Bin345]|nr:MAG: hypothetical protein BWY59_01533 [Verrucomicrobia bacterium ADurb.Bin345]
MFPDEFLSRAARDPFPMSPVVENEDTISVFSIVQEMPFRVGVNVP